MDKDRIHLPNAPHIPALNFRAWHGESDLPLMLEVINSCKAEDKLERSETLQDITNDYRHLERCDPDQDMLMAEVEGRLIAYTRVTWNRQEDGLTNYYTFGFLRPEWRRRGIGSAMLAWSEARLLQIASGHEKTGPRFFQAGAADTEQGTTALLEKAGYQPVRYEFNMSRPISDPLPEAPMPAGLEVRPAQPEHVRPIWDAMQEAFRDHWGFAKEGEETYQAWLGQSSFQPSLWKVAWDGDQVAGMVLNFIDEAENKEYQRLRGYTEGISVRKPWRKLGLARSLLVQSIRMYKEMGMSETALGVDSQNLSGALRLYQGVGYRQTKQFTIYRKALDQTSA
jgi:ribosomal protein S18 acetylase RimI-like enzyme